MPIGALFISLFVGFYYSKQITKEELQTTPSIYKIWLFIVRYIAPIAIIAIFITKIFT